MPLMLLSLVALGLEELEVVLKIGLVVAGLVWLEKDEVELEAELVVDASVELGLDENVVVLWKGPVVEANGVEGPVVVRVILVTVMSVTVDDVELGNNGVDELRKKLEDEPGAVGLIGTVPELLRETGGAVPVLEVLGKDVAVLVLEEAIGTVPLLELREAVGAVPEEEVVPVVSSHVVVLLV